MTKIPNTFFSAKIFLPLNKKVQYMQIILFHISMFLRILTRVCDPKDMFRSCLCVCVCVLFDSSEFGHWLIPKYNSRGQCVGSHY